MKLLGIVLSKRQWRVILTVTFGNLLEWFDVYSYAYLVPIIARVFFNFDSGLLSVMSSFVIFSSGLLTRPFGAILFGRIGDLKGRRNAFLLSIIAMTIPTFLMGCLPTYAVIGIASPIFLIILRVLQSIPVSGEAPGTFCFLYEYANKENRHFMMSFGAFGNQIGAILGIAQTILFDQLMSEKFLMNWGWRILFWTGGALGLIGIYLRKWLAETPIFNNLKAAHHLDPETTFVAIKNHSRGIFLGIAFTAVNATTFYLLATYVPSFFSASIGLTKNQNMVVTLIMLVLTTLMLPLFGYLNEYFSSRKMLMWSAGFISFLVFPLYYFINSNHLIGVGIVGLLLTVPIACTTALLVYQITHLFPSPVRYTGVGLAFNLADGIIGGFSPVIALGIVVYTRDQGAFCWFILASAIISYISYFKVKE